MALQFHTPGINQGAHHVQVAYAWSHSGPQLVRRSFDGSTGTTSYHVLQIREDEWETWASTWETFGDEACPVDDDSRWQPITELDLVEHD